jgi:hypothetical protein
VFRIHQGYAFQRTRQALRFLAPVTDWLDQEHSADAPVNVSLSDRGERHIRKPVRLSEVVVAVPTHEILDELVGESQVFRRLVSCVP